MRAISELCVMRSSQCWQTNEEFLKPEQTLCSCFLLLFYATLQTGAPGELKARAEAGLSHREQRGPANPPRERQIHPAFPGSTTEDLEEHSPPFDTKQLQASVMLDQK